MATISTLNWDDLMKTHQLGSLLRVTGTHFTETPCG